MDLITHSALSVAGEGIEGLVYRSKIAKLVEDYSIILNKGLRYETATLRIPGRSFHAILRQYRVKNILGKCDLNAFPRKIEYIEYIPLPLPPTPQPPLGEIPAIESDSINKRSGSTSKSDSEKTGQRSESVEETSTTAIWKQSAIVTFDGAGEHTSTLVQGANPTYPSIDSRRYVLLAYRSWLSPTWTWVEVECAHIHTDAQFFWELRSVELVDQSLKQTSITCHVPKWLRRMFLSVGRINYVKVAISDDGSGFAGSLGILESPSLPPELQRDYYMPCGNDFAIRPPISPALLMHYYNHPDCASSGTFLLERIPMRLKTRLAALHGQSERSATGWGLEIEERIRLNVVLWQGLASLAIFSFGLEVSFFKTHSLSTYCAMFAVTSMLASAIIGFLYCVGEILRLSRQKPSWNCSCGVTVHEPALDNPDIPSAVQSEESVLLLNTFGAPSNGLPSSHNINQDTPEPFLLPPPATQFTSNSTTYGSTVDQKDLNNCKPRVQTSEKFKPEPPQPLFLIIATPSSESLPQCYNMALTDPPNDEQFFRQLRRLQQAKKRYYKPWQWLTLIDVVAINYVAFEPLSNGNVSLLRRPGYAPPRRSLDYFPCRDQESSHGFRTQTGCFHPIPSATLLRKYRDPASAGKGTFYIDRLTRKLTGPVTSTEEDGTAYGVELQLGIPLNRLLGAGAIGFVLCICFGGMWSFATKDVSAGFSIAGCLMVVVVFTLGTMRHFFEGTEPVYPSK